MASPLIAISTNRFKDPEMFLINIGETYLKSVLRAGGTPVLLPIGLSPAQAEELVGKFDGFVFPGGGDVDPALYAGEAHERVYGIIPERDALEIALVRAAAKTGKPFLGICRGIQVINVALGGTLLTDIGAQHPGAMRHDWYPNIPRDHLAHRVTVDGSSRLAKILGATDVEVNSLHHQAIRQAAPGLKVIAHATDGIIEAVELTGHPFGLGVQWHPECLPELPAMRAIFSNLIEAAKA